MDPLESCITVTALELQYKLHVIQLYLQQDVDEDEREPLDLLHIEVHGVEVEASVRHILRSRREDALQLLVKEEDDGRYNHVH